ncbi:MAG TPA: APC family permease [Steroidobacteraceae bacterium]|nr:APC family permease [Steroidobacteraceae bacterium]
MSEGAERLASVGSDSDTTQLRRTLSFRDLLLYGLAYVTPCAPFQILGFVWQKSNGLIALAYILGGVCMYFTAKSYAVMTEAVPNAGSVYGFARHALGPFVGFVAGWMILLDYLLIPGYMYDVIAVALETLVPQVDRAVWIVLVGALTLGVNWFGLKVNARINMFAVYSQLAFIAVILLFSVLALHAGKGNGALTLQPLFSPKLFNAHALFAATSICVMSYLGFDAVSTLAEEVKGNDRRLVGRAIIAVLILSAVLFALVAWILGNLLSGLTIKDAAAASFELAQWSIGPWASISLAWATATIIGFTNVLPMQVGVARILFAMGRDRQLPQAMARVHPRYGTPYIGMLVASAITLAVALILRFHVDEAASLVNFGALSGFLLLHVSVLARFGVRARSGQRFSHVAVPLLGAAVVLAVMTGMSSLATTLGLAWLGAGLVYGAVLHRSRRDALPV